MTDKLSPGGFDILEQHGQERVFRGGEVDRPHQGFEPLPEGRAVSGIEFSYGSAPLGELRGDLIDASLGR